VSFTSFKVQDEAEAAAVEQARDVAEAFGSLQINHSGEEADDSVALRHDNSGVPEATDTTDTNNTSTASDQNTNTNTNTNTNDDNITDNPNRTHSFQDYTFLDPLQDLDDSPIDAFTDEELIAALNSLQPDHNTDTAYFDASFLSENDQLPEIETDLDDNDPLLEPIYDIDQVFGLDYDNDNNDNNNNNNNNVELEYPYDDVQTLQLLEQLGNLTLDFQGEDADEHTGDGLPSYLYCQPCSQPVTAGQGLLPAVGDQDEPVYFVNNSTLTSNLTLTHIALQETPLSDRDLDALLRLSVMNLEDSQLLDDNDELVQGGLPQPAVSYNHDDNDHDDEQEAPDVVATVTAGDGILSERTRSYRPLALEAAKQFTQAFDVQVNHADNTSPLQVTGTTKIERTCIGHKERIMGLHVSECGRYLATASQDSTIRIWNTAKNSLLTTLSEHRADFECLRVAWASSNWADDRVDRTTKSCHNYLLASGGADGTVYLWGCRDPEGAGEDSCWTCYATLDHSSFGHFEAMDDNDKPQVYALQFIDHWQGLPSADDQANNGFLLTSSDDHVHLWEVDAQKKSKSDDGSSERKVHLREVMSLRFTDLHDSGYGVHIGKVTASGISVASKQEQDQNENDTTDQAAKPKRFGGDRNPQNLVYVFDASYCAANGLLGVALSDGSLRLTNGRGVCLKLLQLPGVQSHLTSFGWDSTGTRLATCVATGHLITWSVTMTAAPAVAPTAPTANMNDETGDGHANGVVVGNSSIQTACVAVMEGGHQAGRPLFGTAYCGANDELLVSWGVDGRVCLWDSRSADEIQAPVAVLLHKEDYPIYAVNLYHTQENNSAYLAVGGGGSQGGFLGVPVYLYNVPGKDPGEPQAAKKSKTATTELNE
jgi:WD40 repeat protein